MKYTVSTPQRNNNKYNESTVPSICFTSNFAHSSSSNYTFKKWLLHKLWHWPKNSSATKIMPKQLKTSPTQQEIERSMQTPRAKRWRLYVGWGRIPLGFVRPPTLNSTEPKANELIEDVPKPRIVEPRDVILKVTGSTVCGSDLHLLHGSIVELEKGDILGHEFCGVVESMGEQVGNLKVGDRVVASFQIACGEVSSFSGFDNEVLY